MLSGRTPSCKASWDSWDARVKTVMVRSISSLLSAARLDPSADPLTSCLLPTAVTSAALALALALAAAAEVLTRDMAERTESNVCCCCGARFSSISSLRMLSSADSCAGGRAVSITTDSSSAVRERRRRDILGDMPPSLGEGASIRADETKETCRVGLWAGEGRPPRKIPEPPPVRIRPADRLGVAPAAAVGEARTSTATRPRVAPSRGDMGSVTTR